VDSRQTKGPIPKRRFCVNEIKRRTQREDAMSYSVRYSALARTSNSRYTTNITAHK